MTFNEEGDWAVQAFSKTPESISLSGANNQSIWLHIGKEASQYGWTGSEGPQSPPVEGTPTPAPVTEPRPPPRAQTQLSMIEAAALPITQNQESGGRGKPHVDVGTKD